MILLLAIIIGLAASLLRARINHRTLKYKKLRWEWLVFIALIPQIVAFQLGWLPENIIPFIQVASMLGLLMFALANIKSPGFWALTIGLAANLLVIGLNGGWMPISPETLQKLFPARPLEFWTVGARLGYSKDWIIPTANTQLGWLSDCLILPQWIPYKVAFSIGDIFISIGAFLLLWSFSRKSEEKI